MHDTLPTTHTQNTFLRGPCSSDFARIEPQRHAPVCVEEDKGVEREVRLCFAIR